MWNKKSKLITLSILLLCLVFGISTVGISQGEKVYRIGLLDDITTLNPWAGYGPDSTTYNFAVYNYWPSLYGLSDVRFDFIPSIADGMPEPFPPKQSERTKEDGGTLWETTVKLKEGVKWMDGSEVDADDVVFSYKTVQKCADTLGGNWTGALKPEVFYDIEKIDDHTVKFYLQQDSVSFKWSTLTMPLVQKEKWAPIYKQAKEEGEDACQALLTYSVENPTSAGPFTFSKREPGAFVENIKNPNYYFTGEKIELYKNGAVKDYKPGVFKWVGYGKPEGPTMLEEEIGPFVDRVIYKVYAKQAAAVLALQKGEIDVIHNPLGLQKGFQEQLAKVPEVSVVRNDPNGFRYLAFNCRKPPYSYVEFRQAVAYLIDKEFITEKVLGGIPKPVYSVIPPGNVGWYNPDVPKLGKGMERGARIQKAVELLKSAGFSWEQEPVVKNGKLVTKGEGLILPSGKKLEEQELLAPSAAYDPFRATFALWIERWLNEIGIPVKAQLTGFNTIVKKVFPAGQKPQFDMYELGWGLGNPAFPDFMKEFFYSKRSHPKGFNTPGYASEEFDKVVDKFVSEWDLQKAREYAYKAQEILARDVPYVVLFNTPLAEGYRNDRIKLPFTESLGGLNFYDEMQSTVKVIE